MFVIRWNFLLFVTLVIKSQPWEARALELALQAHDKVPSRKGCSILEDGDVVPGLGIKDVIQAGEQSQVDD